MSTDVITAEDIRMDQIESVISHLGAAIMQSTPGDDQIIMEHVRKAYEKAKQIRDELQQ